MLDNEKPEEAEKVALSNATISPQAAAVLASLPPIEDEPPRPGPDDFEAWRVVQSEKDAQLAAFAAGISDRFPVKKERKELGGVPAYRISPASPRHSDRTIVHIHGGAFTLFSLESAAIAATIIASYLSTDVITIGYTLAPHARAPQIRKEVASAVSSLRRQLPNTQKLIGIGDSAGGALAAVAALSMRDQGERAFDALVLMSPWSDLDEIGDTYHTLSNVEPTYIYERHLLPSALAYCPDRSQWKDPLISPVYGDYSGEFPPTLIQGGTRETFLSNCVRLYQSIKQAGGDSELDLYEGMTHVFQILLGGFGAPEADKAFESIEAFLNARF